MIYRNDDPRAIAAMWEDHYGGDVDGDDYTDANDDYWNERELEYMEENYE